MGTDYLAANERSFVLNISFMTDIIYQQHHENFTDLLTFMKFIGNVWKEIERKKSDELVKWTTSMENDVPLACIIGVNTVKFPFSE